MESDWFKKTNNINLKNVIENHFDEYICSIFYFYEQGLLCDFLLPDIITKKILNIDKNIKYNNKQNNLKEENNDLKIEKDIKKMDLTTIKNDVKNDIIIQTDIKNNDITIKKDIKINGKGSGQKDIEIKSKISKVPRLSFYDISDQKQNFFEIKANNKKSSLVPENLKKKSNLRKKIVGFTNKKVIVNKTKSLNYVEFKNNK